MYIIYIYIYIYIYTCMYVYLLLAGKNQCFIKFLCIIVTQIIIVLNLSQAP